MPKYCVHVSEVPHIYEDIEADSPQEAKDIVLRREFGSAGWDDISQVEVMLQCEQCGTDNDTGNATCEDCGAALSP